MLLDLAQADKDLDDQMLENVVSLAKLWQFLCMIAASCLPMSEKGVTLGKVLVSVGRVHWDNR